MGVLAGAGKAQIKFLRLLSSFIQLCIIILSCLIRFLLGDKKGSLNVFIANKSLKKILSVS